MTTPAPPPAATPDPDAATGAAWPADPTTAADLWLALEQSGGFRFVTRQLLIYRDGRTTVTSSEVDQPVSGRLSTRRLSELRRQVKRLDVASVSDAADPGSPDAFSYDLTVRVGRVTRRLVVEGGQVPAALGPLLGELKELLLAPERDDRGRR